MLMHLRSIVTFAIFVACSDSRGTEPDTHGLTDEIRAFDKQRSIDFWHNTYDSWATHANRALASKADLAKAALLVGYDLEKPAEMARFVESLEKGISMATELVDAKVLGARGDVSWSNRFDYKGDLGTGPELKGESVTPLFEQLQQEFERLATLQLVAAKEAIEHYQEAQEALATTAERIEKTALVNREAQYHEAGDTLDRYARAHAKALKNQGQASLVRKDNTHDDYSTVMILVGKVRAYILAIDTAKDMFPYDEFARSTLHLRRVPPEASEIRGQVPKIPATTKSQRVLVEIDKVYRSVFGLSARAEKEFRPLIDKVTALLQKMKSVKSKIGDASQNEY